MAHKLQAKSVIDLMIEKKYITVFIITLLFIMIIPFTSSWSQTEQQKETEEAKLPENILDPDLKQVYFYEPEERRDPFLSIIDLTENTKKAKVNQSLSPLENHDIADFTLLGIVFDGEEYYASILIPEGKAFTIRKGMILGLNSGEIIEIMQEKLIVRELTLDYRGRDVIKDVELKLRKDDK